MNKQKILYAQDINEYTLKLTKTRNRENNNQMQNGASK